jgi:putative endonuclease
MPFFVYILRSASTHGYYIGYTEDIPRRTAQHNDPKYQGSKHTKRNKGPWVCVYFEEFKTRSEAMKRERQLKAMKSRRHIDHLIASWQSPEGLRD